MEGEGRPLLQPLVDQLQLTLVPVQHKVVEDGGDEVLGDGSECGSEELAVVTNRDTGCYLREGGREGTRLERGHV